MDELLKDKVVAIFLDVLNDKLIREKDEKEKLGESVDISLLSSITLIELPMDPDSTLSEA